VRHADCDDRAQSTSKPAVHIARIVTTESRHDGTDVIDQSEVPAGDDGAEVCDAVADLYARLHPVGGGLANEDSRLIESMIEVEHERHVDRAAFRERSEQSVTVVTPDR